jgi:hypothetical protein
MLSRLLIQAAGPLARTTPFSRWPRSVAPTRFVMSRKSRALIQCPLNTNSFMPCPLCRVADMVGGQVANTGSLQGEFSERA